MWRGTDGADTVPRPRDLLLRFRFAGAPGAAAGGGVPADRKAEAAAELTPVLALLDPVQEEVRRIRTDARARAQRVRRDAEADAEERVATARATAAQVRAQAATEVVRAAAAEQDATAAATDGAAERVREHAAAQMPAYVDRVVAAVIASLHEEEQ